MDMKDIRTLVDERAKELYQRGTKKHVCTRDDVAWNVLDFRTEPGTVGLVVCFGIIGLVPHERRSLEAIAELLREGGAAVVVAWVGNGRDMLLGIQHVFAAKEFAAHFNRLFVGVETELLRRGSRDKRLVLYTGYKGRVPHAKKSNEQADKDYDIFEAERAEAQLDADAVTEEEPKGENAEVAEATEGEKNE